MKTKKRVLLWIALLGAALGSSACELPGFQRACFEGRECERHPVNGPGGPDFPLPPGR